jgi:glycine oxidase
MSDHQNSKADRRHVVVIGAGICGLGIGWRLAEAGCRVDVFERDTAGRAASWAAAGMLAARVEAEPGEEALLALNLASQRAWPDFATTLQAASDIDLGYRNEGTLVVAARRDDVAELRHNFEFQRGLGLEIDWLSGGQARRLEPHLAPAVSAGVLSEQDHQVDNRQLTRALQIAFLRAGGRLHENAPVESVDVAAGRVRGVRVDGRLISADVVLLAAGAWSYDIDGLPPSARPPVRPLKGQVISLRMDPRAPIVARVLWGPGIYIVPRRDGTLILGATVEDKGFDSNLTAGGIHRLLEAAWEILPQIEELPIGEMWVGFRPTSRDDAPILGPTPVAGLVVATGHHRNGVLLAPLTIDAVSGFVLDGTLDPAIEPFGIDRFYVHDAVLAAEGGQ